MAMERFVATLRKNKNAEERFNTGLDPEEDEHQSKRILEEDGIQPFDLERLQFDAQGDLRLSIEAQIKQMPPPPQALKQGKSSDHQEVKAGSPEGALLAQLEKTR